MLNENIIIDKSSNKSISIMVKPLHKLNYRKLKLELNTIYMKIDINVASLIESHFKFLFVDSFISQNLIKIINFV